MANLGRPQSKDVAVTNPITGIGVPPIAAGAGSSSAFLPTTTAVSPVQLHAAQPVPSASGFLSTLLHAYLQSMRDTLDVVLMMLSSRTAFVVLLAMSIVQLALILQGFAAVMPALSTFVVFAALFFYSRAVDRVQIRLIQKDFALPAVPKPPAFLKAAHLRFQSTGEFRLYAFEYAWGDLSILNADAFGSLLRMCRPAFDVASRVAHHPILFVRGFGLPIMFVFALVSSIGVVAFAAIAAIHAGAVLILMGVACLVPGRALTDPNVPELSGARRAAGISAPVAWGLVALTMTFGLIPA